MKVFTDAGKTVSLSSRNFIAQGGEGSVYVDKDRAYKIYLDPKKAISPLKIKELSVLTKPNIINPLGRLKDEKGILVGYEMAKVPGGAITICEFSSRGYQSSNNVDMAQVVRLVESLRSDVAFVHSKGILIVDLNEMNLLLHGKDIYLIDVDSYQTKTFPATAIMEHVRDYRATKWTEESDWFSWGIVTFQMFTGTHPFKGRHPKFGKRDLIPRMEQGISVFNRDASLPRNCIPLDALPQAYKLWAKAVFEDGKRVPPPIGLISSTPLLVVPIVAAKSTKSVEIILLQRESGRIIDFLSSGTTEVVTHEDGTTVNGRTYKVVQPGGSVLALDRLLDDPIAVRTRDGKVEITSLTTSRVEVLETDAWFVFRSGTRPYILTRTGGIMEIRQAMGHRDRSRRIYTVRQVASVMPKSWKIVGETVIYESFGQWFAVFLPREGESYQMKLPEIAGKKVIVAKGAENVFVVIVAAKGKFSRLTYRMSSDYKSYDVWEDKDIQPAALSFAVLPNGICALLNEENKLELFQTTPGSQRKVIEDDQALPPGTMLGTMGTNVVFADGNELKRVRTR